MTRAAGAAALPLLLTAGCADRGVVSGPTGDASARAVVVIVAVALVVGLLGWLSVTGAARSGGARVATAVLAVQAGGLALGTVLLVSVAVRGDQLLDRPSDAEPAASLLRLSGLDGRDARFFQLMAATTAVIGLLGLVLLVLAARCAAGDHPVERAVATVVLGAEAVGSLVALGLVLTGDRGQVLVTAAMVLPLLVVATWSSWPRATHPPASA